MSSLQVVRIYCVHTHWYLGTKALNPREFSFQSVTFGFRFLSVAFYELKVYVFQHHVYRDVQVC